MNERIKELAEQAGITANNLSDGNMSHTDLEKFAELIVHDCIKACQQEWYALNNEPELENESIRGGGIRVGQKNGVLKAICGIKQHFGITE